MDVFNVNRVAKTKPLKGTCSKTHNDTIVKDTARANNTKKAFEKPDKIFCGFKNKPNKKKSHK